MTCTVCGAYLPAGTHVCTRCGTPVATPPPSGVYVGPTVATPPNQGPPGSFASSSPAGSQVSSAGYQPYVGGFVRQNRYQQPPSPLAQEVPPLPPQYQPLRTTQDKSAGLIIGIVTLLILLVSAGSFLLLARTGGTRQVQQMPSTPASISRQAPTATTAAQQQTTAPAATPTQQTQQTKQEKIPYAPGMGTLVLNDPLRDNTRGYKWSESTTNGKRSGEKATCSFAGGRYHISRTMDGSHICVAESPTLMIKNIAFEAHLSISKGNYAGLAARIDPQKGTGYLFVIGTDGSYAINVVNMHATNPNNMARTLRQGINFTVIRPGLNQDNTVAIVINGNKLSLYVNGQLIDSLNDSSLSNSGLFGFFVNSNQAADLSASNARAWNL